MTSSSSSPPVSVTPPADSPPPPQYAGNSSTSAAAAGHDPFDPSSGNSPPPVQYRPRDHDDDEDDRLMPSSWRFPVAAGNDNDKVDNDNDPAISFMSNLNPPEDVMNDPFGTGPSTGQLKNMFEAIDPTASPFG